MPIQENIDFVLAPKATVILDGVNTCAVLGTTSFLFLFPLKNLQGAGMTSTITTTTIGGRPAVEAFHAKTMEIDKVSEFESWLRRLLTEDLRLDPKQYILEIPSLEEFDIKFGLLSKGLYYKTPYMKRRNGIGGISKKTLEQFEMFYRPLHQY